MLFAELLDQWRNYPKHWDLSYRESLASGIWSDPSGNIQEKIKFLNEWLCRIDVKTAYPALMEASEDFRIKLTAFNSKNLINSELKIVEITDIYSLLNDVKGLGPTGISKYLHMHKPELFIMWDNQIFRDYFHIKTVLKSTATPVRYYNFMKRMKEELLEAINDYKIINGYVKMSLIEFKEQFNNESFPRVIDKYNYVTRGKEKRRIESH